MATKIRVAGRKPASKPAPKRAARKSSTAKPAAKTSTKRSTAKKADAAPAKRGPGRPRKTEAEKAQGPVRRASKGVDARVETKLLKAVQKAGDRREKAKIEHEESVDALHTAVQEALEQGVSMAKVADASGISRQWLYKMGDYAGRSAKTNGKAKSKPAAKAAVKRTPKQAAAKTSTRKAAGTRKGSAAKKSGTSTRRIRARG